METVTREAGLIVGRMWVCGFLCLWTVLLEDGDGVCKTGLWMPLSVERLRGYSFWKVEEKSRKTFWKWILKQVHVAFWSFHVLKIQIMAIVSAHQSEKFQFVAFVAIEKCVPSNFLQHRLSRLIFPGMNCAWMIEEEKLGLTMSNPTYTESQLRELLASLSRHKKKVKIKHVIPLSYLWMGDCVDLVGTDNITSGKNLSS